MQMSVIYQILLEIILEGRIPRLYEVIALILGVIGAIVMANK